MKRQAALDSIIAVAGGVTMVYMASVLLEAPAEWIIGLYLSAMAAMVWMAIRILKDPHSTGKTFDEYFYQDRNDIRRNGSE